MPLHRQRIAPERGRNNQCDRRPASDATNARLETAHAEAHDAACGERADLNEVTHLVGDPQAAAVLLAEGGRLAVDEGLVDAAAVRDLADQRVRLRPDAKDPSPAAVAEAVGGDLVGGQDEIGGAFLPEPGAVGVTPYELADARERALAEGELLGG